MHRYVGRYEIVRPIGAGGMAVVHLARQRGLDRLVALKELVAPDAMDPAFLRRFVRESRVAASLTHPNIVTVYEYFESESKRYIAMEYLAPGSLRPHIGDGLPLPQIAGVLEGLLAALSHAAAHGVVHRDVKPENVMVTAEGRVKLADFGIAKPMAGLDGMTLTSPGTALGTPGYMAPEQAMAQPIGPRTDLYSVGCVAYEMATGRIPFAGTDAPMALLLRHISEPARAAMSVDQGIDPRVSDWIARLLCKDPRDRPPSALAAWQELEEIVIAVAGPRWRRRAPLEAAPRAARAPARAPASRPGRASWAAPAPLTEAPVLAPAPPAEAPARPASVPPAAAAAPRASVPPAAAADPPALEPDGEDARLWPIVAVVLLLALGSAALAVSEGGRPADKGSTLRAGAMFLRPPPGWVELSRPPRIRGLALTDPIAVGPMSGEDGAAVAGIEHRAALLPPRLAAAAGTPARVRLQAAGVRAFRYDGIRIRGGVLTVYVARTSAGVATLACLATTAGDCRRLADSITVPGARALPLRARLQTASAIARSTASGASISSTTITAAPITPARSSSVERTIRIERVASAVER
jgi:hypothetical protein